MNLYVLRPIKEWDPYYDMAWGFVIKAHSAKEARVLAQSEAGDEGDNAWLDSEITTCKQLQSTGKVEIVLRDFHYA